MKKLNLSYLLVVILLVSISIQIGTENNEIELNLEYDQSNFTDSIGEQIDNEFKEIIVFADNVKEFREFLSEYSPIKIYENLYAFTIEPSIRQLKTLSLKSDNVYPLNLYQKIITQEIRDQPISNNLQLQTVTEANRMNVNDLWDLGYNGTGVTVAVFDDGVDFTHPALQGKDSKVMLFNEWFGETAIPCKSHGTQVAGLIAAYVDGSDDIGNAPGANLYSLEMGCDSGDLLGDPIAGFNWLIGENDTVSVLNLSWGSETGIYFAPLIERLANSGILTVAAAGNNLEGPEAFTVTDPAATIGALAVGAVDINGIVTSWSNRGPSPQYQAKPDVIAPGVGIRTTNNQGGYNSFTGTSASSPLAAGSIATLISALNANGINWNVGTLKAAVMRTAVANSGNELAEGQGFIDILGAWNYLLSVSSDEKGPQVLEITPNSGPFDIYQEFPVGITASIPFTLVSSHPSLVDIELSGDLSSIASIGGVRTDSYSQLINIELDTNGIPEGTYTGTINASLGNDWVTANYSILISGTVSGKVLFDIGHTNWDITRSDVINGDNTGEMIKIAQNKGLWVEEVDALFTPELLSEYEVVWIPDPLSLSDDPLFQSNPLFQSEINALLNYVSGGGSLLVDFNGLFIDDFGTYGTNATGINSLISEFGISASESPIVAPNIEYAVSTYNKSQLVKNIPTITHFGNFLTVTDSALSLAGNLNGDTLAIYTNELGGKVMVATTNFWMDNFGAVGNYGLAGGVNDKKLSINSWDWLFDNSPPVITIGASVNNTGYPAGEMLLLQFIIQDAISELNKGMITAWLDGNQINMIGYLPDTGITTISIPSNLLTEEGHWYILVIEASDISGNSNHIIFTFYVGSEPVTTFPTTIPDLTNSTTPTTSTDEDPTSTTSSSTVQSITSEESKTIFPTISLIIIMISLFSAFKGLKGKNNSI